MPDKRLVDYIGAAALYEQTAEECIELAHACMKYARMLRGENKVHKSKDVIILNIHEEIADVDITMNELFKAGLIDMSLIEDWIGKKYDRMCKRLEEDE